MPTVFLVCRLVIMVARPFYCPVASPGTTDRRAPSIVGTVYVALPHVFSLHALYHELCRGYEVMSFFSLHSMSCGD